MSDLLDPLKTVRSYLLDAHIIPDVIPADPPFTPAALLVVEFPTGEEALLGNALTTHDTAHEPMIEFTPMPQRGGRSGADGEPTYTLVMTDPDAPSSRDPTFAEWRHWVITGVKAANTASAVESGYIAAQLTKSAVVTPYQAPAPPRGTGAHRYVLLLYREPEGFAVPSDAAEHKHARDDRKKWSSARFAARYGLALVTANYFVVVGEE